MTDRTVRTFVPDDAPAILELELASFDQVPVPGSSRAEIAWTIDRMALLPANTLVAVDAGRVVGQCTPRADLLTVHPAFRRRGHGRRLVDAARELVGRQGLDELTLWGDRTRPEAAGFIDALGAVYRSSLWQFVLPADRLVPAPVFPADVMVRAVRPGDDDDRYVELINRAFEDHPSPLSWPGDYIREVHARPEFDPASVLVVTVASDPDRMVEWPHWVVPATPPEVVAAGG